MEKQVRYIKKISSILIFFIFINSSLILNINGQTPIISNSPRTSPWPMDNGNPQRTGLSNYSLVNNNGTLRWKFLLDGSVTSSPVIDADGCIYIGTWNDTPYAKNNTLYVINPDGTLKWKYNTETSITSAPAIDKNNIIYFGDGGGNSIYALQPNGTLIWKSHIASSITSSSILIDPDGNLIFSSGSNSIISLYKNGSIYWIFKVNGFLGDPVIDYNGTIYFGSGFDNRHLYALFPNGTLKWTYLAHNGIGAAPSIGRDGTIYFGDESSYGPDNFLYALYPNGTLKWKFGLDSIFNNPTIGLDGTIYINGDTELGNEKINSLYAINPNGKEKWNLSIDGKKFSTAASIGKDGTIIIGSNDNNLYAIYPNGTVKWKFKTGDLIHSTPSIGFDGSIFFSSSESNNNYVFGFLYAISPNETISSPPLNLNAISGNKYVYLKWNNPNYLGNCSVVDYNIYRGTSSGKEIYIASVPEYNNFFLDRLVNNEQKYYYFITSKNKCGESEPSNEVDALPSDLKIDDERPIIIIKFPENNSKVKTNHIIVNGIASDNVTVIDVKISNDNKTWISVNGTNQWSGYLNLTDGRNKIYAKAIDPSGNEGRDEIGVNVIKNSYNVSIQEFMIYLLIIILLISGIVLLVQNSVLPRG